MLLLSGTQLLMPNTDPVEGELQPLLNNNTREVVSGGATPVRQAITFQQGQKKNFIEMIAEGAGVLMVLEPP